MMEGAEDFDGVVPLLDELLEPPDARNISQSFDFLFAAGMLTLDSDEGCLTPVEIII